jgi:hypothetical protein
VIEPPGQQRASEGHGQIVALVGELAWASRGWFGSSLARTGL